MKEFEFEFFFFLLAESQKAEGRIGGWGAGGGGDGWGTHLIQDVGNAIFNNEIRLHNQHPIDKIPTAPNRDGDGCARFRLIRCTIHQTGKIEHLIYQNMT